MAKDNEKALHYELTSETKLNSEGVQLFRIRATRDIPAHDVKKGDVGGWVSSTHVSSGKPRIGKNAWVAEDAEAWENARITGHAHVGGEARACGKARIKGHATVGECALVAGRARVAGKTKVWGDAVIDGHARIRGESFISEGAWVSGHARVEDSTVQDSSIFGHAVVKESRCGAKARISGNAYVHGTVVDFACLSKDAHVESCEDFILLGPFGKQAHHVTAFQTEGWADRAAETETVLREIMMDPINCQLVYAAHRALQARTRRSASK